MPYKRHDSPVWWVSYTDPTGQRVRRSTETTDRKEAEALQAKWKLEVFRVKQWEAPPLRTFEELMLAYLQGPSAEKRRPERDRYSAQQLRAAFSGQTMNDLTPARLRAYIVRRQKAGAGNGTINREIGLLSAAINWARRELEWTLTNPVAGRRLREPEGRMRWITREEARRLIQAAEDEPQAPHLAAFIRLALHTGMRRDEMLRLEWTRVDFQNALLFLESLHTKSGKRRSIPLNTEARAALIERARFRAAHCPDSPWVFCNEAGIRIASLKRSWATACRRAGISNFHLHDLRHTCAAWLVQAGVPLPEVRDLLGHRSVTVTERYAHLAPENVRAAVVKLEETKREEGRGFAPGGTPVTIRSRGVAGPDRKKKVTY